jgi:sulfate/thiosulfate transport system substrate-binding protein
MTARTLGLLAAIYVAGSAIWLAAGGFVRNDSQTELLNVACDPTRELWKDLNEKFIADYERNTGVKLSIRMSHGGSASQARAVIDGLEADVATLGLWSDTSVLHQRGLVEDGWTERLPHRSLPYYSTIVFVVRKGNPKEVRDWDDLVTKDVQIITPNPKTSGNGKLSFLAAWGVKYRQTRDEDTTRAFLKEIYRRVPILDTGARGATDTFSRKRIGDVHLTWENEAALEVHEAKGELEVVYPKSSIRAEPPVVVVDRYARAKGTKAAADAYMDFLYTPAAQDVIASHSYRPSTPEAWARHKDRFPAIELFNIEDVTQAKLNWDQANERFFTEGGEFDRLYSPPKR